MTRAALALVLLSAVTVARSGSAETGHFKVVVNASRPTTLTRQQVADIFLKRATRWVDGTMVAPYDLSVVDATRQSFSNTVLGQSTASVVFYWQRQMSAAKGVPPLVKTPEDLLSAVQSTAGGIGYVSEGTELPEGVKAVTVVEATH
jgi:ABC-type phosphate transport system substrate-binding protein